MVKQFFTTLEDQNIAYHVTTDKNRVDRARKNLALKYQFDLEKLCYMEQTHSSQVLVVEENKTVYQSDGLVTNKLNTPLMVMVADCIPILFSDPIQKTIAVAHAGRVGTFENISKNTIQSMQKNFNCDPKNITVTLGPSIQKCCYEVSSEIALYVEKEFGNKYRNKHHIDLQAINKSQLLTEGVLEENISSLCVCTKCSNQPYFSYRKENSCGRFAGVIIRKI